MILIKVVGVISVGCEAEDSRFPKMMMAECKGEVQRERDQRQQRPKPRIWPKPPHLVRPTNRLPSL